MFSFGGSSLLPGNSHSLLPTCWAASQLKGGQRAPPSHLWVLHTRATHMPPPHSHGSCSCPPDRALPSPSKAVTL